MMFEKLSSFNTTGTFMLSSVPHVIPSSSSFKKCDPFLDQWQLHFLSTKRESKLHLRMTLIGSAEKSLMMTIAFASCLIFLPLARVTMRRYVVRRQLQHIKFVGPYRPHETVAKQFRG